MKTRSDETTVTRLAAIFMAVVLLIPGIRGCSYFRSVERLESQTRAGEQDNKERERTIEQLHETKTSELVRAAEQVKELEKRLDRNRELVEKTEEAKQKLDLVKSLIAKHARIAEDIRGLKGKFPELLSEGD